ncbi:MAG: EVE domain-containing protein [Proteobacteria bacterium]|nr:EVE domain-containing protein [Pseudomonadota bacterium]
MAYWLMKSEPDAFSLEDLMACKNQTEPWDGIRNYQARNFMRDDMRIGDKIFFYHSNTKVPGIVGIAEVASEPYPDFTAFDSNTKYFDPKSDPDNPRWILVDIHFIRKLDRIISLAELREHEAELEDFALLRKGNRLSIIPVGEEHWNQILKLEYS